MTGTKAERMSRRPNRRSSPVPALLMRKTEPAQPGKKRPGTENRTAEIRQKATAALQAAGEGLSEEMRQNMYQALDIIAGNMKEICEGDIPI